MQNEMAVIVRIMFMAIVVLALLGALDYIIDSVRIFTAALRKHRDRNKQ